MEICCKVPRRGEEEKNITWKKAEGKQYDPPHNFEAVGKNIASGEERKDRNFCGRKSRFMKMGLGKNVKLYGTF